MLRTLPSALPRAIVLVSALIAADAACRRAYDERPVAALSSAPDLEARFDALRTRWMEADSKGRAELRSALAALVIELDKRDDGLEPLARAYLALSWLDAGVPAAAEAVARPLIDGPAGVPNDLGTLVKGAAARRLGHPRDAIDLLRPLIGKLIDGFARPLLYQEICEAFLDDGRFEEAIVYAEGWLRSATGAEKKEVRAAVTRVLARVPLAAALRVLEADALSPVEAKHSPDMVMILTARVESAGNGDVVAPEGDAGTGDAAPKIAAADAAAAPLPITPTLLPVRFDPRTIALIVPISSAGWASTASAVVRAAAAVASPALATALHADAGTSGAPSPLEHRLTVLDSGGTALGVSRALDAAEREGAGVIVGGLLDAEANALAALAQQRHIPTVLLRQPSSPPPVPAGEQQAWIAVGPSLDAEAKATLAHAQVPATELVIVDPWPVPGDSSPPPTDPQRARCDAQSKLAGATAFPIAAWQAKKVAVIVVLGDSRCARRVADEIVAATKGPWRPTLVLAPSALELAHVSLPLVRRVVGIGLLPADDAAPSALRLLWKDQGGPVGFGGGLGHDATALAAAALPGDLPPSTDAAGLQKARATTLTRLLASRAELWTSQSKGPGAGGIVPPVTLLRVVPSGSAVTPGWM